MIHLFLGPTISPDEARAVVGDDTITHPPVSQGDVYGVALRGPRAIGIIDGYFHKMPAVWHKEILWAMSQGIHVYGAASMGALRAAELHPFGMVGVGKVFAEFRDGVHEDDDEVAVLHGPAESGYRAMSEAMVNIRATLARAHTDGVLSEASRAAIEAIAKGLYYGDRSYPAILERADVAEKAAFRDWLPKNRVDQKKNDALELLSVMRDLPKEPKSVDYRLEYTTFWDRLVQSAGAATDANVTNDAVVDELRLEPAEYLASRDAALIRALALRVAKHEGHAPIDEQHLAAFRAERGLGSEADFQRWLDENQLGQATFEGLVREEAMLAQVVGDASWVCPDIAQHLRKSGRYASLHARARDKRERLERAGLWDVQPGAAGAPTRDEVLAWHFERASAVLPADPRHHVRALDFGDVDRLVVTVLREMSYRSLLGS